jgi:hypothetical protein
MDDPSTALGRRQAPDGTAGGICFSLARFGRGGFLRVGARAEAASQRMDMGGGQNGFRGGLDLAGSAFGLAR